MNKQSEVREYEEIYNSIQNDDGERYTEEEMREKLGLHKVKKLAFNETQKSKQRILELIDDYKDYVKAIPLEEFDKYSFANVVNERGGECMTMYHNAYFTDIADMISHLNVDLIDMMIRANYIE
jgi:hypothetical protein